MGRIVRKQIFSHVKTKAQISGNCEADQCLCFHYTDSTIPLLLKGMDSEQHKTPYVYVKYHHKFIPSTRECISGLLRKIFVFKVGKPSFFPASE